MIKSNKTRTPILALILFVFSIGQVSAENKVVVIPMAADAAPLSPPIVFRVRGEGYAVKNLNAGTTIETNIWEIEDIDTANAFNTTTKRFYAPEEGYYYLHAVVDQSNNVSSAFFRIWFNVDSSPLGGTTFEGHVPRTEVSGIFHLTKNQEVYVWLRNYSTTENERIDGYGSYFEGYKIK